MGTNGTVTTLRRSSRIKTRTNLATAAYDIALSCYGLLLMLPWYGTRFAELAVRSPGYGAWTTFAVLCFGAAVC